MIFHIIVERFENYRSLMHMDVQAIHIQLQVRFFSQKSNGKRKEKPQTGTPTKTKRKYFFAGGN